MTTATVEELKQKGNKAFSDKDYNAAISFFTQAIDVESNHVIYSNRSAAHCALKDYEKAEKDAESAIKLCPTWSKGYGRLGAALYGQNKLDEAEKAYEKGLEIEPESAALKKGLEDVKMRKNSASSGFEKIFSGDFLGKISASPKTGKYMMQPDFVQKMRDLQNNPSLLNQYISDPRVMEALGVLMGIDFSAMSDMENQKREEEQRKKKEEEEKKKEKVEVVLTESQKEKQLGTAAYKLKDFEQSLSHYNKAWELEQVDISILTNKAAVFFEMGSFDQCIKECEVAIETGRELRSDFKLIAKAYARIGNAYMKLNNEEEAIKNFEKSITEHRTPEIVDKLKRALKSV